MPTLPDTFASSTIDVFVDVLTSLSPMVYLILGVGLTAAVLVMIVRALLHH